MTTNIQTSNNGLEIIAIDMVLYICDVTLVHRPQKYIYNTGVVN